MHASASYAHTDILEYLISVGGDINLRDDDGDTPLYVVESVEMAMWMVERGAEWGVVNEEGLSVSVLPYTDLSVRWMIGMGKRSSFWQSQGLPVRWISVESGASFQNTFISPLDHEPFPSLMID